MWRSLQWVEQAKECPIQDPRCYQNLCWRYRSVEIPGWKLKQKHAVRGFVKRNWYWAKAAIASAKTILCYRKLYRVLQFVSCLEFGPCITRMALLYSKTTKGYFFKDSSTPTLCDARTNMADVAWMYRSAVESTRIWLEELTNALMPHLHASLLCLILSTSVDYSLFQNWIFLKPYERGCFPFFSYLFGPISYVTSMLNNRTFFFLESLSCRCDFNKVVLCIYI